MRVVSIAFIWMLAAVVIAAPAGGQARPADTTAPAYAITPEEAVSLGLERHPAVRAAGADADLARAALDEARSGRLPTIRSQATYTRLTDNIPEVEFSFPGVDTTFTILPVELDRYHTEISIEQPLFTGFRIQNQIRTTRRRVDAAAAAEAQEAADLALEIRTAYWQLFQAITLRDALDVAIEQVEEHVRVVEERVAEERALRRDLLAAQTRRSEVLLERIEADNAVAVARLELNRLIGAPLETPTMPADEPEIETPPPPPDTLITQVLEARPQIEALEEEVEALRLEVEAARSGWLPELYAVGRYVYARPNPYFFSDQQSFRGTGEIGLSLQWNLFEGGRRLARTRQAEARLESAAAGLAEARDVVAVAVTRQYLEIQRALQAIVVAEQYVEEAAETYRVVQEQFAEEAALPADVLDAERAYRQARAGQAAARADYAVARAALLNTLGRVW